MDIKAFQELEKGNREDENSFKEWHSHPAVRSRGGWLQLEHYNRDRLFSNSNKLVTKKSWRTGWLLKPLFVAPIFSLVATFPHNQFWRTCWFNRKLWCRWPEQILWKSWKECNLHIQNSCCWICQGSCSWLMGWGLGLGLRFIKHPTSA